MLPAARVASRLIRPAVKYQAVRCYGAVHGPSVKERVLDANSSMDQLPSPAGDFQTEFAKRQKKYNIHLLTATAVLLATIIAAKTTGTIYYPWPDTSVPLNIYEE